MTEAANRANERWRSGARRGSPVEPRRVALGGDQRSAEKTRLERLRCWAFIAILAWSPLPLGSERPWAWTVLGLLVALLLVVSTIHDAAAKEPISLRQLRVPLVLGAALTAWIVFQSLAGNLLGWHHPLWDQASEILGATLPSSISVDREASWTHLFRLLTYAGIFLLAWQIGQRASAAALIVKATAAMGAIYAVYGLIELASPQPSILWMRKTAYLHDVTSTFVNRNSFATFAGLATLAGLTLIAQSLVKRTDTSSRTTILLSTIENVLWRGRWPVLAVAITGPALLLSHSRGGMFATLCGVLALGGTLWMAPSLRVPGRRVFMWFLILSGLVGLIVGGAGTIERLESTVASEDGRTTIMTDTLPAIADNWLSGVGLGGFQFIYPMYQSAPFDGIVDLAHNDYLENMLELGVPGALILFALVGYLVYGCFCGVQRRRKDALYPCLGAAASVLVAVHSLFDFSLQIPAVAALYATFLGIGAAQALSSRRLEDRRHLEQA